MNEGFTYQANYKIGDLLLNIRADDAEEFKRNLEEAEALGEQIMSTYRAFSEQPASTGAAVDTIRRELAPVSVVGDGTTFGFGQLGTGANSPREDALAAKGFVPDKWHSGPDEGGWWHPTKFAGAPACQCQGQYKPNQGKLALKVGRSQVGKEYKAWVCANTFNKGAKSGCPNNFNGPFPEL